MYAFGGKADIDQPLLTNLDWLSRACKRRSKIAERASLTKVPSNAAMTAECLLYP
jgi:hypothetical protein